MGINKTTSQETQLILSAYTGNEIVRISQPNGSGGWDNFYVLFADMVNYFGGINTIVKAATAALLPNTPTYNNGTGGLGATLTSSTNSVLVIDGYTPALNDRILVKNQASAFQNGVYFVSQLGVSGTTPWVLTRAFNYNQANAINDTSSIPVINGTVNAITGWALTSVVNTIGTDALNYTQLVINPSQIITGSTSAGGSLSGTYPNPLLKFTGASAGNTAAQVVANTTFTTLTYSVTNFDTNSFHSTVTNTSRMTVPTGLGGKYRIWAQITFAAASNATEVVLRLLKNGSAVTNIYVGLPCISYDTGILTTSYDCLPLNAGDYVELQVYQGSGSNLNITGNIYTINFLGV